MAENLFARLSSIVKPATVTEIAKLLGAPEQAVSRGLALSTATAFAGLARKADDSETLRQVIDVASRTRGDAAASAVSTGELTNPRSPVLSEGHRLLASLFGGGSLPSILNAIGRESGLTSTAAAALLPLGAQSLLNFLGSRVRDEGLTPGSLASFLKREATEMRRAMPVALDDAVTQIAAGSHQTIQTNPVVAQAVVPSRRSIVPWVLASAAALAGAFWLFSRPDRAIVETPQITVGTSGTAARATLGNVLPRRLTDGTVIRVPEDGVENRLLAFINDPSRVPSATTWFDFDRLLFDTGSATLRPQSADQLRSVAAILKANPGVNVRIGGYTDTVGSPEENLRLSQQRATNVMNELVRMGVAPGRLDAKGYGGEHPVADNSTEAGRAQNRRISMLVTRK